MLGKQTNKPQMHEKQEYNVCVACGQIHPKEASKKQNCAFPEHPQLLALQILRLFGCSSCLEIDTVKEQQPNPHATIVAAERHLFPGTSTSAELNQNTGIEFRAPYSHQRCPPPHKGSSVRDHAPCDRLSGVHSSIRLSEAARLRNAATWMSKVARRNRSRKPMAEGVNERFLSWLPDHATWLTLALRQQCTRTRRHVG